MSTASWKNQGGFSKHRNVASVTIQNQKDISTLNLSLYPYAMLPQAGSTGLNPGTIIYSQNSIYYKDEAGHWEALSASGSTGALWSKDGGTNNIYYNHTDGNVGIGLDSPNVALDVSGNINVDAENYENQIGYFATGGATVPRSTAIGFNCTASGIYSTAIGFSTTASGNNSTAMGKGCVAQGDYSTAMGNVTWASADNSTAMGFETIASSLSSTAMGYQSTASGDYSTAMGTNTTAGATAATAMGFNTTASGDYSTAMGQNTDASAQTSTAMGLNTVASADSSMAMGAYSKADINYGTAIGNRAYAGGDIQFAIGATSAAPSLPIASEGDNWNAFVIDISGNVGISTTAPTHTLDVSGDARFTSQVTADSFVADTNGIYFASSQYQITRDSADSLAFITNGITGMTLDVNGNVGIGVTGPSQTLDVSGNVKISGALYDSVDSSGSGGQVLTSTATGTAWGANGGGSNWITDTNGIHYDKNVGIGKHSTFGHALDVGGDVDISGNIRIDAENYRNQIGYFNTGGAIVPRSTAIGYNTAASGQYSTAIGHETTASGDYSTAMGSSCTASGFCSTAMGSQTTASVDGSIAMGGGTNSSGFYSMAMGNLTTASSSASTAMGSQTTASGEFATAMGQYSGATGSWCTAIGNRAYAGGDIQFAIGASGVAPNTIATAANNNNAFVIDISGNVSIKSHSAIEGYDVPQLKIIADPKGPTGYNEYATLELKGAYIGHPTTYGCGIRSTYGLPSPYREYGDLYMWTTDLSGNVRKDNMIIRSTGHVLIGTTTTGHTSKLTILSPSDINKDTLELQRTGKTGKVIFQTPYTGENVGLAILTGSATGAAERMRITPSGDVGIHTDAPSQALDISGNVKILGALYDSGDSSGTIGHVLTSTGTGTVWGASGATHWVTDVSGIHYSAGNVGIGTDSAPTRKLDVSGNVNILGRLILAQSGGQTGIAIGIDAGLTNQGNNAIAIGEQCGKTNQGNYSIAIGMEAGLTGQANNSIAINADNSTLNPGTSGLFINPVRIHSGATGNVCLYNAANKEISCHNPVFVQIANGNVGIGTTSPQSTLDVSGNIHVNAFEYRNQIGYFASGGAIGDSSTAIGRNTLASGNYSIAIGQDTIAEGNNSTAMGLNTKASGTLSTAMGQYSGATGSWCTAIGNRAYAGGDIQFAIGASEGAPGAIATAASNNNVFEIDISGNTHIRLMPPFGTPQYYAIPQLNITAVSTPWGTEHQWATLEFKGAYDGNTVTYGCGIRSTYGFEAGPSPPETRNYGDVYIYTTNLSGNVRKDNMVIRSNGNVAIGTPLPPTGTAAGLYYRLRVEGTTGGYADAGIAWTGLFGNINTEGKKSNVYLSGGNEGLIIDATTNTSNDALLRVRGGTGGAGIGTMPAFYVGGDGKVGIGLDNSVGGTLPTQALDVSGNIRVNAENYMNQIGYFATGGATVNNSTAIGYNTLASGQYSTAMGYSTIASGLESTAMGQGCTASGNTSMVMGFGCEASGSFSTAMGAYSVADINYGTAIGNRAFAGGDIQFAIGATSAVPSLPIASGGDNWNVFVIDISGNVGIGLGDASDPSWTPPKQKLDVSGNVIISGNVGIGVTGPTHKLDVQGDARFTSQVTADSFVANTNGIYFASGTTHITKDSQSGLAFITNGTTGMTLDKFGDLQMPTTEITAKSFWTNGGGIYFEYHTEIHASADYGLAFINASSGITGMTMDVSGQKFGIGVTGPTQALDVSGNIICSGNVGIGVTGPTQALDVSGNITGRNKASFLGPVFKKIPVSLTGDYDSTTTLTTFDSSNNGYTLTAEQVLSGYITKHGFDNFETEMTLPPPEDIIAAIPDCVVGSSFRLIFSCIWDAATSGILLQPNGGVPDGCNPGCPVSDGGNQWLGGSRILRQNTHLDLVSCDIPGGTSEFLVIVTDMQSTGVNDTVRFIQLGWNLP